MTSPTLSDRSAVRAPSAPWQRPRPQAGYTLIEVMLVVAISALVLGPLFAWTMLVMRQQPVQQQGMIDTAQAGLLRAQFPRDVVVAGAARVFAPDFGTPSYVPPADETSPTSEWSTWREPCKGTSAAGGRRLAVLISQGEARRKTLYSVAPTRDGDDVVAGSSSIWRTECDANTGENSRQSQVVQGIVADPARTMASCTSTTGDEACRRVTLTVARPDDKATIELSSSRRTDLRSLTAAPDGNFLPIARITVVSQTWNGSGSPATTVRLSAADSSDPDGSVGDLSFRWDLPSGPEGSGAPIDSSTDVDPTIVLPAHGEYWIRLTVQDAAGAQNTSYRRLEIVNRAPTAVAVVTPSAAIAGQTRLEMSGGGSFDPDGSIAAYRWTLSSTLEAGEGLTQTYDTADAVLDPVPDWAVGSIVAELTVTDNSGATASDARVITVIDPLAPVDPEDPGPVDPEEPEPGAPVARIDVGTPNGLSVAFDAGTSTGANLTYEWEFGLLAGTGSGAQVTKVFPGPGSYTVTLRARDDQDRTSVATAVVVLPGAPAAPTNIRVEGTNLVWDPRAGARRYFVDFVNTSNGCARELRNQAVAPSATPRKPLPPSPCTTAGARATARVGVEGAPGTIVWSNEVEIPVKVTK